MIRADLQKELQEKAERTCRENNKKEIPIIHLKHNRQGHTNFSGYISIPIWAVKEGKEFLTYYLLHELTHWILSKGHCQDFRRKELELLSKAGLEPIYSRVYVKALLNKDWPGGMEKKVLK